MRVEFIGYAGSQNASETIPPTGSVIDIAFIESLAKAQECVGFDRVLLAFHVAWPKFLLVGQHVATVTDRLGLMIAHRPGFVAPTLTARQFATLKHTIHGQATIQIITGADDAKLAREGDHLTKEDRYAGTSEYLNIVRQEWTATKPFNYAGKYYLVEQALSGMPPRKPAGVPVYFGGTSAEAIAVAGSHADVFALSGESLVFPDPQLRPHRRRARVWSRPHSPSARRHSRTVGGPRGGLTIADVRAQAPHS